MTLQTSGWGPERDEYTRENPAPLVTFNSIVDNPRHGDERNFVQIKKASDPSSAFTDAIPVDTGETYEVFVFYHNNAAANLNDAANDHKGIAVNAHIDIRLDQTFEGRVPLTAVLSADNATPKEVWDSAFLTAKEPVSVRYVPSSAVFHSFGKVNDKRPPGDPLADTLKLGFDQLDGNLPGCNEHAGYLLFHVRIDPA